jgi:hypothetical protein
LRVRARIARVGHTFRLELEIESDGGVAKRSLSNAQCSALAEAAAVLVALAIEPQTPDANPLAEVPEDGPTAAETPASAATARAGQPAQRQDRQTSPPDGQPPTAERSAEGPRQRDSAPGPELGAVPTLDARDAGPATSTMQRLGLQLSASARGSLGLFPHAALGVHALLELHPAPFYAAVGVTYWPTGEQRSSSYPNASLRGAGLFADLSVGFTLTAGPLAVTPALCAELGGLRAEALGIDQPQPKRVLWAAAGASLLAAVSVLSHWTLGVEVAGLVPIFRTKWLVQSPTGDAPTYEASLVAPRVSLRLGYRFR